MSEYQKLNKQIIHKLIAICGENQVITEGIGLENYAKDSSHLIASAKKYTPEAVVTPKSVKAVAEVVKLANEYHVPLTPRGAGSGLAGGCVPVYGGIVLSVEKLNQVLEVDEHNGTVTVESGVLTNEINEHLKDGDLFYAGFPMSLQNCMIGGNIATNAGGGKAVKYGVTGRHVLGIELITPLGEIVSLGGKNRKDKAGYNLKDLVIGSEGTLGIVTKAILNLEKRPKSTGCSLAFFENNQSAAQAILSILSLAQVPSSLELIDRMSFIACNNYVRKNFDMGDASCALLIAFEEENEQQVNLNLDFAEKAATQIGVTGITRAITSEDEEDIWSLRQCLAKADGYGSVESVAEDIVVPFADMPAFMVRLGEIEKKYNGLMITNCGHAADGNLHTALHRMPGIYDAQWQELLLKARAEIYLEVKKLGGKLTGEHGVGLTRAKDFVSITDPNELELMKLIKNAWDPNNIMNPGKIFV
ncbi:MAG TPA: FAD-binding oxidoreductase [Ruminiclostridium sp.]